MPVWQILLREVVRVHGLKRTVQIGGLDVRTVAALMRGKKVADVEPTAKNVLKKWGHILDTSEGRAFDG